MFSLRLSKFCRPSTSIRTAAMQHVRSMSAGGKIIYTETDEAPCLATYALLPIIRRFTDTADIEVKLSDISVAGRILSLFPERLVGQQKVPDNLSVLGELAKIPEANIIKLPNISASVPQLIEAITELQSKDYNIPDFPANPKTPEEVEIKQRYSKVLGSAVNPVLREGNSDRRVAAPVKEYAKSNPHKMGAYSPDCRTHVAHMTEGDFYGSEQSYTMPAAGDLKIEFEGADGTKKVLRESVSMLEGEVADASRMSAAALEAYFEREIQNAKDEGIMLSLHLKATMMKISDPIMFGMCVRTFFKDVFAKHERTFAELGVNANNGLGDVFDKIASLPPAQRVEIEEDIAATYNTRPGLAMVNSDKGITNLHVPSDVIVDASMPVVVRDSGKMWNKDDELEETKCLIPDRCYAPFYDEVFKFCKEFGQFDPATMGNVANVGLMAQKAEEYGSHDKTFQMTGPGTVRVTDSSGTFIFEHSVGKGDIWRMCQTKDVPIRDWVGLAVRRARATGDPAIFWLDANRAHDQQLIAKVETYLKDHDTSGLEITIAPPVQAVRTSMERARDGLNTISVTGNVLRDYLTDLFPILELGTSAKMLSIVPLLGGGGMFETGAGGSAPKHVQQFQKEGHLRWDSLGEYLALAVSLEDLGNKGNAKATVLGEALNRAVGRLLDHRRAPSRRVNEIDNRGESFYIALYWAQEMAPLNDDIKELADQLTKNRKQIIGELQAAQGAPMDTGGYYKFDAVKTERAMRPSTTLNNIINREVF